MGRFDGTPLPHHMISQRSQKRGYWKSIIEELQVNLKRCAFCSGGGPGRLLELQELARRSQNVAISISDPPPPTQPSQTAALTASHSSKPLYPPDHRLSLIVHPHTAGLPGRHRRALAGARIGHFHVPRGPMVCTPPAPRLTPTTPQS